MMDNRGTLVVISGFSGAGKGTVSRALVEKYGYRLSISATTRQPREGEQDGKDYFFKTENEFLSLVDYNGYIEYAQYVGHYYGTPRKFVEDSLNEGQVVILEIEVQGAMKIKEQYPDAILLFITAPSIEILKNRLVGRGTEAPEVIEKRMRRAVEETWTRPWSWSTGTSRRRRSCRRGYFTIISRIRWWRETRSRTRTRRF